ncbi:uncharacterized protein LOC144139350 [Haemaphysalis longicornis]
MAPDGPESREIRLSCVKCRQPSPNAVVCSNQHLVCWSCTYTEEGVLRGGGCPYCRRGLVPPRRPDGARNVVNYLLEMAGVRACPYKGCCATVFTWSSRHHYREHHGVQADAYEASGSDSGPEQRCPSPSPKKRSKRQSY